MGTSRAWTIWGLGVLAYAVAVFHRTSLSVAGVEATERFAASSAQLATFGVVQLLVYALMQVPVGVLLDRFGSRRLIVLGGLVMALGQLALAQAETLPLAIAARVLVGVGDALTFISVLRLVPAWFTPARTPLLTQVTGQIGQIGQVASALPFAALLHARGWTSAYGCGRGRGSGRAVGPGRVAQRAAGGRRRKPRYGLRRIDQPPRGVAPSRYAPGTLVTLHVAVQRLGVRDPVGLSVHGRRGRTVGDDRRRTAHSAGDWRHCQRTGSRPAHRALSTAAIQPRPRGGDADRRGLDRCARLARPDSTATHRDAGPGPRCERAGIDDRLRLRPDIQPPTPLGSATGMVNVGGFVASVLTILGVGVVLDLVAPDGPDLAAYKVAFCVQYLVWFGGGLAILRTRRLARRRLAEEGTIVRPLPQALRARRKARRKSAPD